MQGSNQSNEYSISPDKRRDVAVYLDGVMRFAEGMADLVGQHLQSKAVLAADELRTSDDGTLGGHERPNCAPELHVDSDAFRLSCDSMRDWLENYAWNVPVELNCEVTLEPCDAELLVDEIAQFLWDFSHLVHDSHEPK